MATPARAYDWMDHVDAFHESYILSEALERLNDPYYEPEHEFDPKHKYYIQKWYDEDVTPVRTTVRACRRYCCFNCSWIFTDASEFGRVQQLRKTVWKKRLGEWNHRKHTRCKAERRQQRRYKQARQKQLVREYAAPQQSWMEREWNAMLEYGGTFA